MCRIQTNLLWRALSAALVLVALASPGLAAPVKDIKPSQSKSPELVAISLSSENFSSSLSDGNVWLIEFYTPWCGHCRNFASSYDNVAASFHSSPSEGIRVAKVDCSVEKALRARFGVESYPSFFLVDGWSVYKFEKRRSEAALMDFARGGYKKQTPIPSFHSPMGPMGLLQGTFILLGVRCMEFFQSVTEYYGVSPIAAGIFLSFAAVIGGMFSILLFAVMTTPKAKVD